jgi:nucleoid DNA-binding protein
MMYEELYRYFIQHKKLAVPGVGTFLLERKPAVSDFVNKQINPPAYPVSLQASSDSPSINFFKWLADTLHISDHDAIIRFNDFVFDLKKQINDGSTIEWQGMGTFNKGLAGELKFAPAIKLALEMPVAAKKVIREKAEHMVRVGEDQKTSAEMTEMLNQPKVKKSLWWVAALALGLLSLLFIGWNFYEHGIDVSSTANSMKLVPMEASAPYQALP